MSHMTACCVLGDMPFGVKLSIIKFGFSQFFFSELLFVNTFVACLRSFDFKCSDIGYLPPSHTLLSYTVTARLHKR